MPKTNQSLFTDSRYTFGVVHDFGALRKHRKFLKSDGKPVLNHELIDKLLSAVLAPSQVAVCKCAAHTSSTDAVSRGNARADSAAKTAALTPYQTPHTHPSHTLVSLPVSLTAMQSLATREERRLWSSSGAYFENDIWIGPNGNPCFQETFLLTVCKIVVAQIVAVKKNMFVFLFSTILKNVLGV